MLLGFILPPTDGLGVVVDASVFHESLLAGGIGKLFENMLHAVTERCKDILNHGLEEHLNFFFFFFFLIPEYASNHFYFFSLVHSIFQQSCYFSLIWRYIVVYLN